MILELETVGTPTVVNLVQRDCQHFQVQMKCPQIDQAKMGKREVKIVCLPKLV